VTCEEARTLLSDALSGEAEETPAFREHLASCAPCRAFFQDFVWQDIALAEEGARSRPAELARAIRAALGGEVPRRSIRYRRRKALLPLFAAAGVLALVAGAAVLLRPGPAPAPVVHAPSAPAPDPARRSEERRIAEERLAEIEAERQLFRIEKERAERARETAARERAEEALRTIERRQSEAVEAVEKARSEERRASPPPLTRPEPAPLAATFEQADGEVFVLAGGTRSAARKGLGLLQGQGIETDRGKARLLFADGSSITLEGHGRVSEVFVTGGKRLVLGRGALRARVTPQPAGRPMVMATPHGEATVLGTTLRIAVGGEGQGGTRLEVFEGRVRLKAGARAADVSAGHFAVAAAGVELAARPLPEASLSFQDGVFPDPFYAGSRDTGLAEKEPSTPKGAAGKIEPNGDEPNGTGKDVVGLFKWDLTDIPPGCRVRAATLTLYTPDGTDDTYQIAALRRDWDEAQATWLEAAKGRPWQAPGAAGPQDRDPASLGSIGPRAGGEVTVSLNPQGVALVQSWINTPSANHGLIIYGASNTDGLEIVSRESPAPARRPKLSVTYLPAR
jgi:ferric-dicitrate binding protein FerR (iron transport regulator)